MLKTLGKGVTTKKQMDDNVKEVKASLTNHQTLAKRTNAVISKAEKAETELRISPSQKKLRSTAAMRILRNLNPSRPKSTKTLTAAHKTLSTIAINNLLRGRSMRHGGQGSHALTRPAVPSRSFGRIAGLGLEDCFLWALAGLGQTVCLIPARDAVNFRIRAVAARKLV